MGSWFADAVPWRGTRVVAYQGRVSIVAGGTEKLVAERRTDGRVGVPTTGHGVRN